MRAFAVKGILREASESVTERGEKDGLASRRLERRSVIIMHAP